MLEVLFADRPDVAERVHGQIAVGIVAGLSGGQIDPGELESVYREGADLLIRQAQLHRHRVEATPLEDDAARGVELIRIDQPERGAIAAGCRSDPAPARAPARADRQGRCRRG